MKKFRFSDGQIITASSKEEAVQKHKVIAKTMGKSHYAKRLYLSEEIKKEIPTNIDIDEGGDTLSLFPYFNEYWINNLFDGCSVTFDSEKKVKDYIKENKNSMKEFVELFTKLKNNKFFKDIAQSSMT